MLYSPQPGSPFSLTAIRSDYPGLLSHSLATKIIPYGQLVVRMTTILKAFVHFAVSYFVIPEVVGTDVRGAVLRCRRYGLLQRQVYGEIMDARCKCSESRKADDKEDESGKGGAFWFWHGEHHPVIQLHYHGWERVPDKRDGSESATGCRRRCQTIVLISLVFPTLGTQPAHPPSGCGGFPPAGGSARAQSMRGRQKRSGINGGGAKYRSPEFLNERSKKVPHFHSTQPPFYEPVEWTIDPRAIV